jgi:spore coat polysaccharide biosynthesis predicted glycosyltransferase SpsG
MGGSDPTERTPAVVRAFEGTAITVDAIVGPGFSPEQEEAVRTAAVDTSAEIRVVRDPDDLVERMAAADFAVSTASTTTYELLAAGTPLVSIPVAENQRLIASALRDRDIAIVLDPQADRAAIADAIKRYTTDPALRRQRRDRGRSLVDANGTMRVATALLGCR